MFEIEKYCRFCTEDNEAFIIKSGGTILINGSEEEVRYINDEYFMVGLKCYHAKEFYDRVVDEGLLVIPGKGLVTKNYGPNYERYKPGTYDIVSLPDFDNELLEYSDLRIIRETLPLGRYAYDIVSEYDGNGYYDNWICRYPAMCNHLATVISCKNLFKDNDENRIYLKNDIDFS